MKKRLLCLLLSGFIALTGLFAIPQDTYAVPVDDPDTSIDVPNTPDDTETPEDTETTDEEATEGEESKTCYDQVGAIGWLVCPTTGFLSKLIDGVYGIIQSLLQVNPVSTDQDSPIYVVWEYVRNLTNIIFIIFILVVIYSQLTGFGLNNYGIKKVLPRIIITAVLVNLSFIICALAVDVSNILGGSLRGIFTGIQENAIANGAINEIANFSISEVVTAALGTAAVGTGAVIAGIAIAGGIGAALWMLLPVILAGVVAVVAALITLAARQALVLLLIMIAPMAFVAYLLPNTESWFKKWKDLFMRMLIFYPMFSVLFGASQLAGWVIITAATNWFGVILGIAVQILPLFFALPLMKMSGTILGKINDGVRRPFAPAQSALKNFSTNRSAVSKAEYTRKALARGDRRLNPLSAASWRAFGTNLSTRTADRKSQAEEDVKLLSSEQLNARKRGTRIIGYRDDGSAIYTSKPYEANKLMKNEYEHRTHKLRAANQAGKLDNAMSTMGDHMTNNKIDTSKGIAKQIQAMTNQQGQNFLDSVTVAKAAARNDLADKRFYYDAVIKAQEDPKSEAYANLVIEGAGADGMSADKKIRTDALTGVVADAYSMFEAERKGLRDKYTTYYTKQKTKDVLALYDSNIETRNIDAMVAAHDVLGFRGDFDKIGEKLQKVMDSEPGYVELGSDFANTLASSLLGMKDKDPALARLGKHINMETWRYSNDNSARSSYVTMEEFITGTDASGIKTKTGGMMELLKGTSMKGIERTAFGNIKTLVENTYSDPAQRQAYMDDLTNQIMPQLITAIPTFESGGEQIINTVAHLTGLTYRFDASDGKVDWRNTDKDGNATPPRGNMVEKYLKAFTPNDLANMKTDAFLGTMKALQYEHGISESQAHAMFRNMQEAKGNLEVLRKSPQVVAGMKSSIREALGLDTPPTPPTP